MPVKKPALRLLAIGQLVPGHTPAVTVPAQIAIQVRSPIGLPAPSHARLAIAMARTAVANGAAVAYHGKGEELPRAELHEFGPARHVRDEIEELSHCEDEILIDRHFARGGEPVAGAAEGELRVCRRRDAR